MERLAAAEPVLVDVVPARAAFPEGDGMLLLHSGPPIAVADLPGCTRGAIAAIAIDEGWADSPEAALALLDAGDIALAPGHDRGVVAPVCGVVGPSSPVFVVRNEAADKVAYCPLNEGRGAVARYGVYEPRVLEQLRWLRTDLAPLLGRLLRSAGGLALVPLLSEALHMGDDLHNRTKAFTAALYRELSLRGTAAGLLPATTAPALEFVARSDVFGVAAVMAACKAMLLALEGVPGSSVVTTMAQNGHEFGIRVAGLPGRWFTAPAPRVEGVIQPPWKDDEAALGIGDSVITECVGFGGFATVGAPAIYRYIGGDIGRAREIAEAMYGITLAEDRRFAIPVIGYRGVASGIDAALVAAGEVTPIANAGMSHKDAGVGQIGAGYVVTPRQPFADAVAALEAAGRSAGRLAEEPSART